MTMWAQQVASPDTAWLWLDAETLRSVASMVKNASSSRGPLVARMPQPMPADEKTHPMHKPGSEVVDVWLIPQVLRQKLR